MEKFLRAYRACALFFFNCCVYGLLLSLAWLGGTRLSAWAFRTEPVTAKYGRGLERAYPGFTPDQIHALLVETWTRPFSAERYTEFKERAFAGKYVHVDPEGFRWVKDQASWPPGEGENTIFVFGGSTVFGYGLPDDMTIPSFLQERLAAQKRGRPPRVYNFGRGYYTITRERILYEELLVHGHAPKTAIFIDGVNEFAGQPAFTRGIDACLEKEVRATFSMPPLVPRGPSPSPSPAPSPADVTAEDALARYIANKQLLEEVSRAFGVRVLFVWQPIPFYGYDASASPFKVGTAWGFLDAPRGYALMHDRVASLGGDFLWAADIQRGLHEPLYVDGVHYGEKLSRLLAGEVADALQKRGF